MFPQNPMRGAVRYQFYRAAVSFLDVLVGDLLGVVII
jgi:hypothetical protein